MFAILICPEKHASKDLITATCLQLAGKNVFTDNINARARMLTKKVWLIYIYYVYLRMQALLLSWTTTTVHDANCLWIHRQIFVSAQEVAVLFFLQKQTCTYYIYNNIVLRPSCPRLDTMIYVSYSEFLNYFALIYLFCICMDIVYINCEHKWQS